MKPDRPQWIRRYRRSLNLSIEPSETFDGRSYFAAKFCRVKFIAAQFYCQFYSHEVLFEVLSSHSAVASCRAATVLAARRRGVSECMIRNAAARLPKFWVTERRAVAKLKVKSRESQEKIALALGGLERYVSATLRTISHCGNRSRDPRQVRQPRPVKATRSLSNGPCHR